MPRRYLLVCIDKQLAFVYSFAKILKFRDIHIYFPKKKMLIHTKKHPSPCKLAKRKRPKTNHVIFGRLHFN